MTHMELCPGSIPGITATGMYKVMQPASEMANEEYAKLMRSFQNYSSANQPICADQSSYESSSPGVSSDSGECCYESNGSKYCCKHASEPNYSKVTASNTEAPRKPAVPPKPCYFTPTHTGAVFYAAPNLVTGAAHAGYNPTTAANASYNDYVYDLVQYQNQWMNSYMTHSTGYYVAEQINPIYSNLPIVGESHKQVQEPQKLSHTQDNALKNMLRSPIKNQIEKFEYLLSQINDESCNRPQAHVSTSSRGARAGNMLNKKTQKNTAQNQDLRHLEAESSKSQHKSTKTFLGLYEVLNMIGVGGGGVVYAGTEISSNKPIAIKRIMREKVKRWGLVGDRKVPQEIALMIRVNGHKNVIKLINWYECLDSYVMIMERPNNSIDLFDYIRAVGRIPEEEGAYIFRQVVEAVKHVQDKGVLHRDVKDENVIIDNQTKKVKLIDFGCGTLLHNRVYTDFSGTPEFYPPEWYTKKQYSGRPASVWSLGVLLYDMLCGEIPFKTKSKIVANKLVYKVYLSEQSQHLIKWMLSMDERSRPTLTQIMNHPWIKRHTG